MNFIEIRFSSLKTEVENFLKREYNKASILFSTASPYGQILSVIENLHQLSLLYLKNTITQFDISNPNALNGRIIRNAAIFAGHNPTRAISSSGTLKFSLKSNIDLEKDIPGGRITILNRTHIKNNTNSYDYSMNLGVDKVTYLITSNYKFYTPIIQGKWNSKKYTGKGEPLQTIFVSETGRKDIDNFNIEVIVNGDLWTIKKHIYDLIPDEQACVVRTGFDGGVDVIFGNGGFGKIPDIGSVIEIGYLTTDGSDGNIFRRTRNDWKFIGDVLDGYGSSIDPEKIFDIEIYTDINFGADGESLDFTRSVLPIVSNNFVLALPQQYAYHIKKLGVFSHVNAYEKSGTIFISITPNVNLFKNQNSNYFNINVDAFILDNYEKSKIDKYLKTGGNIQLTKKYKIVNPKLTYYIANIYVMPYSDASDESVNSQILEKLSSYFLNLSRVDRIPKLDLIRELSSISDIHSVDIQFVSKKNEDYHKKSIIDYQNQLNKYSSGQQIAPPPSDYSSNTTLGLDPILGDILFEPDELPIIRGGWSDRNDIYFSGDIDSNGLKTVNIIKKGTIDSKNKYNI